MMKLNCLRWIVPVGCVLLAPLQLFAQGTLADYKRAERFLPGKMRHLVFSGDVTPHWIEKTDRFWYRNTGPKGTEFILVDAEQNSSAPAFDHVRLATALSNTARREYNQRSCRLRPLISQTLANRSAFAWKKSSGRAR